MEEIEQAAERLLRSGKTGINDESGARSKGS